jgi:hypothetical protein
MRLSRIAAAAVGCALALAACAFNASPAQGLKFQPPPGWQSSPGIMGFMQFWRTPNDREALILFKSPTPLTANDVFSNDRMKDTLKDMQVEQRHSIQICGNQPATYVRGRGTSPKRGDEDVEMVFTTINRASYFALYTRPIGAAPNFAAQAALRELCPKT